jgi:hypothetical protein
MGKRTWVYLVMAFAFSWISWLTVLRFGAAPGNGEYILARSRRHRLSLTCLGIVAHRWRSRLRQTRRTLISRGTDAKRQAASLIVET